MPSALDRYVAACLESCPEEAKEIMCCSRLYEISKERRQQLDATLFRVVSIGVSALILKACDSGYEFFKNPENVDIFISNLITKLSDSNFEFLEHINSEAISVDGVIGTIFVGVFGALFGCGSIISFGNDIKETIRIEKQYHKARNDYKIYSKNK